MKCNLRGVGGLFLYAYEVWGPQLAHLWPRSFIACKIAPSGQKQVMFLFINICVPVIKFFQNQFSFSTRSGIFIWNHLIQTIWIVVPWFPHNQNLIKFPFLFTCQLNYNSHVFILINVARIISICSFYFEIESVKLKREILRKNL